MFTLNGKSLNLTKRPVDNQRYHRTGRRMFSTEFFANDSEKCEISKNYKKSRKFSTKRRKSSFAAKFYKLKLESMAFREQIPVPCLTYPRFNEVFPWRGRQTLCKTYSPPDEILNDSVRRIKSAQTVNDLKSIIIYNEERLKHKKNHKICILHNDFQDNLIKSLKRDKRSGNSYSSDTNHKSSRFDNRTRKLGIVETGTVQIDRSGGAGERSRSRERPAKKRHTREESDVFSDTDDIWLNKLITDCVNESYPLSCLTTNRDRIKSSSRERNKILREFMYADGSPSTFFKPTIISTRSVSAQSTSTSYSFREAAIHDSRNILEAFKTIVDVKSRSAKSTASSRNHRVHIDSGGNICNFNSDNINSTLKVISQNSYNFSSKFSYDHFDDHPRSDCKIRVNIKSIVSPVNSLNRAGESNVGESNECNIKRRYSKRSSITGPSESMNNYLPVTTTSSPFDSKFYNASKNLVAVSPTRVSQTIEVDATGPVFSVIGKKSPTVTREASSNCNTIALDENNSGIIGNSERSQLDVTDLLGNLYSLSINDIHTIPKIVFTDFSSSQETTATSTPIVISPYLSPSGHQVDRSFDLTQQMNNNSGEFANSPNKNLNIPFDNSYTSEARPP